jgi:acyl-CoA synthetase (AMP-forming)/AMP-acid ligase II
MPTIDSVLARAAHAAPHRVAIREWDSKRQLTYAQLDAAVSSLAGWLHSRGLHVGASIGIHLPNGADFLIAQFAAFRCGGVAAYINYRLAAAEAVRQLKLCGAQAIVTTTAKAVALRDHPDLRDLIFIIADGGLPLGHALTDILAKEGHFQPPEALEDADAIARFTSGSTGAPKGVLVTHRAWLVRAVSILAEEIQVAPYSTTLVVGPLSHQAGLFALPTFLRHGTLLIVDGFGADKMAAILGSENIGCAQLVPTMMHVVLEDAGSREALRTSGVSRVVYGGSPIRRPVLDDALQLLPNPEFVQIYGSHEAGSISYLDGAAHRDVQVRSSAGRPFLAVQVRLRQMDDDGLGEIEVKAPWKPHARLTEQGCVPDPDEWAPTGDIGEIKDGFIYLRDRLNDVIISGGFNVYPLEIEAVIDAFPGAAGSVIVSAPDDRWGERVIAYVVPRDASGLNEAALAEHCRQHLANYKVPKEFRSIPKIPLNVNGKPDRRKLSQPMWEGRDRRIN